MEIVDGIVVPESPLLRRELADNYGSVPGIPDEELADPAEIERQVYREALGPILVLPVRHKGGWIRPALDGDGGVDWGAFGTVDFDRIKPPFDAAKYKADKLREELRDIVIRLRSVSSRVKDKRKYVILKHVRMGLLDLDQIVDNDMWNLARLYLRARKLRREIRELTAASQRRRQWQREEAMARLGV